jgi:hypothetical protein
MSKIEIIATSLIIVQIIFLLFFVKGWNIRTTFRNTIIDWVEGLLILYVLIILVLIILS